MNVTRVVHLVASVDLCDLAILVDYLREADVMTDDFKTMEGVFLIIIVIRDRGFLHQTVRMVITLLVRRATVHWRVHELCLEVGAVWATIAHD